MIDSDGYPTDELLERIASFEIKSNEDLRDLLEFVQPFWKYKDRFTEIEPDVWYLSTGGWSGNESIVYALQRNYVFIGMCFVAEMRGGHYIFTSNWSSSNDIWNRLLGVMRDVQ